MYASFLSFCAPCIWTFLNSLFIIEFFNKLLELAGDLTNHDTLPGISLFPSPNFP
jgi:hypothetical protein